MAASITQPFTLSQQVRLGVSESSTQSDVGKLQALVRANLNNMDRMTFEDVVNRAYRMGNESCHRAMAAATRSYEPRTLEEIERLAIESTYALTHGDAIRAARILGIGKTTFYRKLRQYGIVAPKYEHCPNCGCRLKISPLALADSGEQDPIVQ